MTLMWIGDAVLLLVIVPAVVACLQFVLAPILQIKKYADEIAAKGALFGPHLDETVPEIVRTRELVRGASPEITRYLNAIDQV